MNNFYDKELFDLENIFNEECENGWKTNEFINYSNINNKKINEYISCRILEITCGETPYITSRYDMQTGKAIAVKNRIGLLDRKLLFINDKAKSECEWLKLPKRAYKSVYGYEYQGDNLIIARYNLFMSFIENYKYVWHKLPSKKEISETADIISRNFWQMDGLKGTVPIGKRVKNSSQITFDEYLKTAKNECECKIYDYKKIKYILYSSIKEEGNDMKFDFVIGNPPYQKESTGNKKAESQIYHFLWIQPTQ